MGKMLNAQCSMLNDQSMERNSFSKKAAIVGGNVHLVDRNNEENAQCSMINVQSMERNSLSKKAAVVGGMCIW
jgi:hypothetical protein